MIDIKQLIKLLVKWQKEHDRLSDKYSFSSGYSKYYSAMTEEEKSDFNQRHYTSNGMSTCISDVRELLPLKINEIIAKIEQLGLPLSEQTQLVSLVKDKGYIKAMIYLEPLKSERNGRDQVMADRHRKILEDIMS